MRIQLLVTALSLTLAACSTSMGAAAGSGSSVIQAAGMITVSPANATIPVGQTLQLTSTGGSAPYSYNLLSGSCRISATGLISTGSVSEQCIFSVSDSLARVATVFENVVSAASTVTYSWVQTGFGACSTVCGGGVQSQSVSCQSNAGAIVPDGYCAGTRPATSQTCNAQACGFGQWGYSTGTATMACSAYGIYGQLANGVFTVYLPNLCNQGTSCVLTDSHIHGTLVYSCN